MRRTLYLNPALTEPAGRALLILRLPPGRRGHGGREDVERTSILFNALLTHQLSIVNSAVLAFAWKYDAEDGEGSIFFVMQFTVPWPETSEVEYRLRQAVVGGMRAGTSPTGAIRALVELWAPYGYFEILPLTSAGPEWLTWVQEMRRSNIAELSIPRQVMDYLNPGSMHRIAVPPGLSDDDDVEADPDEYFGRKRMRDEDLDIGRWPAVVSSDVYEYLEGDGPTRYMLLHMTNVAKVRTFVQGLLSASRFGDFADETKRAIRDDSRGHLAAIEIGIAAPSTLTILIKKDAGVRRDNIDFMLEKLNGETVAADVRSLREITIEDVPNVLYPLHVQTLLQNSVVSTMH